jgi:hypothetical protein
MGRPWLDLETGKIYFRLRDFQTHMERNGFKEFGRNKITTRIKLRGGGDEFFNIKGKGVNVWYILKTEGQKEPFDLPNLNQQPF